MPTLHKLGTGIVLLAAFASLLRSPARAAVIENDMVLGPSLLPGSTNKMLTLTQSIPPGQGFFAIEVQQIGSTRLRLSCPAVAETYAFYPVDQFTTFDPAYAQSHTPLVSNDPKYPLTGDFVFNALPFAYFAYWDERFGGPAGPDPADNYGWMLLYNNSGDLEVSSGATAIGGGILVGSTSQVPEPSPALLAPLFTAAVLWARRPARRARR